MPLMILNCDIVKSHGSKKAPDCLVKEKDFGVRKTRRLAQFVGQVK